MNHGHIAGALEIELRVDEMKYLEEGYSALPVTGH